MKRRKLLAGLGSLAAGGAAVLGTGAVDTISASRDLAVDIEGAGSAYLGVDANTDSSFVDAGNPVSLDFASDSGNGGSGIIQDGYTEARPAFSVANQGDDTLYVGVLNSLRNNDISTGTSNNNGFSGGVNIPAGVDVQFIASNSEPGFSNPGLIGRNNVPTSPGGVTGGFGTPADPQTISLKAGQHTPYNFTSDDRAGYVEVEPGEDFFVTVRAIANDFDLSSDSVPNVPFVIEATDNEGSTRWNTNLTDTLGIAD